MILKKKIEDGKVKITFILAAGHTHTHVAVVGDFNDWDPHAHVFERRPDGTSIVSIVLPAGNDYTFRYLADGGCWFDEDAPDGYRANEFGSGNCVLST